MGHLPHHSAGHEQLSKGERVFLWILVPTLIAASLVALAGAYFRRELFIPLVIVAAVSGFFATFFIGVLTRHYLHAIASFCFLAGVILGVAGKITGGGQALDIVAAAFTISSILIEYKAARSSKTKSDQ